jgi:hypothetical protein
MKTALMIGDNVTEIITKMNITLSKEEAELLLNLMTTSDMNDEDDTLLEYDCSRELMGKLLEVYRKFDND